MLLSSCAEFESDAWWLASIASVAMAASSDSASGRELGEGADDPDGEGERVVEREGPSPFLAACSVLLRAFLREGCRADSGGGDCMS